MSKLIIANWKANKNAASVESWFQAFEAELSILFKNEPLVQKIAIAGSFPLLPLIRSRLDQLNQKLLTTGLIEQEIQLGIQDISQFGAGSYTGAVSGQNLTWLKPGLVILGHSERRKYFHETSQTVAAKYEQVIDLPATPLICVDAGEISAQAIALGEKPNRFAVVAYEPVEAIGTGHPAGIEQVKTTIDVIKQAFGRQVSVIYGGSVDELSIGQFLLVSDGVLVGTASLDGAQFARVLAASQGKMAI